MDNNIITTNNDVLSNEIVEQIKNFLILRIHCGYNCNSICFHRYETIYRISYLRVLLNQCPFKDATLHFDPVVSNNDIKMVSQDIRLLLDMNEQVRGVVAKILCSFMVFDHVFQNYQLVLKYKKFGDTFLNKLIELETCDGYNDAKDKLGLTINPYTLWKEKALQYNNKMKQENVVDE